MSIHRKAILAAVTGIVGVFGLAGVAGAAPIVVVQHEGAADPVVDEGWLSADSGTVGMTTVAVTSDTGGLDAWKVADGGGDYVYYHKTITSDQAEDAASDGWIMRMRHRVVAPAPDGTGDRSDAADYSIAFIYDDAVSGTRWGIQFGTDAAGNPIVNLPGTNGGTVTGISGDGYHLYELTYDPVSQSASLTIDNADTPAITAYAGGGYGGATSVVRWGSASGSTTGEANYNLVEFQVVPDPATIGLSALGGLLLLSSRQRMAR